MRDEERIKQADAFAARAHAGQVDKAGAAYIEHPRAVARQLAEPEEKIVALLHDTIEDTGTTQEELCALFGERVAAAVALLTRPEGEDYFSYVRRVRENALARRVKAADLRHNMDLSRLSAVTEADRRRVEKYRKALALLLEEEDS